MAQAVFDLCVFDEVAFDEGVVVPTAITQAASNIEGTAARINGKISDDGGASCEARFRWRKAEAKYEYCSSGTYAGATVYGDSWRAQSFTPQITHNITSVKLYLRKSSSGASPGDLTVSIKATDGEGKPTGEDLCVGTTNGNTLPSPGYEWREITFSSSATLTASTKYAIVCRALDGDSGNIIYWACVFEDPPYLGGCYMYSNNGGSSWTIGLDEDCYFEEWGVPAWTTTEWQNTLETNDTYYEDLTELDTDTEYEFQTQAKNSAGEGAWSASAYFTTTVLILSIVDSILVGDSRLRSMIAGLSRADGLTAGSSNLPYGMLSKLDGIKAGDSLSLLTSLLASDGLKIGDSPYVTTLLLFLIVADSLKLGDSNIINLLLPLIVTDGTKLGDSPSILARLIISDGLELGGSLSREMVADLLYSDGVKLGDFPTLGEAILYLAIVEGLKAGDTSLIGMLADILAADGTKLGDATIQSLLASLGIEDGLKLGATELADLADGILLSIIEGIKIGDSSSLDNLIELAILEAIKVGDTGVLGGILGRILKLVIITTQNRKVNVTTCQKRKVRPITTQNRKVRVITGE